MRSVTYSMNISLDGYIVGPDGGFRSFRSTSVGWISNSSRPAPSTQRSSTCVTAWRARRLTGLTMCGCGCPYETMAAFTPA